MALSVAVPAERVPAPSVAVPSLKVTVPVGDAPLTVAVKVTACPARDGLRPLVSVVVVGGTLTVCDTAAEVLPWLFASPP